MTPQAEARREERSPAVRMQGPEMARSRATNCDFGRIAFVEFLREPVAIRSKSTLNKVNPRRTNC